METSGRSIGSGMLGRNGTQPARTWRSAATTGAAVRALPAVLAMTLGLAAMGWVVALREMPGMDMGPATRLGSIGSFAVLWVAMMAAMMLPGAVPALVRRARADGGGVTGATVFLGSYLGVWALVGLVVYALYRPHGPFAAGVLTIAAGVYELTPPKRQLRRRCGDGVGSGLGFGLACVGSSIGLMVMLLALGVMSVLWMSVIAAVVLAQKLLPPNPRLDVSLALAIVVLGFLVVLAPSTVPGLTPSM
ncbi:MAG TPA: DUF2182 domain-containing protein [Actinomycetota bacterium]|nr:DUF2182 domain-containing protein [Actinomycetota bacterium]